MRYRNLLSEEFGIFPSQQREKFSQVDGTGFCSQLNWCDACTTVRCLRVAGSASMYLTAKGSPSGSPDPRAGRGGRTWQVGGECPAWMRRQAAEGKQRRTSDSTALAGVGTREPPLLTRDAALSPAFRQAVLIVCPTLVSVSILPSRSFQT